jgi:protein gp37
MAKNSEIQWTNATWNPWHGCQKVSPGCKYCYMFRDKERYGHDPTTVLRSKSKFNDPLKWKEPQLIFTCSWSDWFIEQADPWRDEAWEIIRQSPQHTFQILTKRPERIQDNLPEWFNEINDRVWIGVSVESNHQVGRIDYITNLPCITFISFEPLIDEIDWTESMNFVDWCIIGGESGNASGKYRYRPLEIKWIEKLVYAATAKNIACFVKQLGTYQSKVLKLKDRHAGDIHEFPEGVKIRQFPSRFKN